MKAPEGFVSSKSSRWYRPWVKEVSTLSAAAPSEDEKENDPVIKMAGSQEPATFTREGKSPNESLLGYRWSPGPDTISTDKGDGLNLHPARRGLRQDWACLRSPEDLLRLHAERPLRHRHALSASHSTFDPLMTSPWVAVFNNFCYRLLVLNTELKTSVKKNNKEKFDDLLSSDYFENHLYYMVDANLRNQVTFAQPRSWRLPMSVNYNAVEFEIDTISDGCWGALGSGVTLVYLYRDTNGEKKKKCIHICTLGILDSIRF